MHEMFHGVRSFNSDLTSWDVSGVTDMSRMFGSATSFNGDVSPWDASGVTDMSGMFFDATSFNGDISDWDVSSVAQHVRNVLRCSFLQPAASPRGMSRA